jgi:hypothetical protein
MKGSIAHLLEISQHCIEIASSHMQIISNQVWSYKLNMIQSHRRKE